MQEHTSVDVTGRDVGAGSVHGRHKDALKLDDLTPVLRAPAFPRYVRLVR
jgi:hypothetical protein